MKPADIERHINELRSTVTAAELNYQIWWIYKGQDTRPLYIESMNRYSGFFRTSIHAHFVASIIATYRLYERRIDTIKIDNTLKNLPSDSKGKIPDDLVLRVTQAKEIWKKVGVIRNSCFGHLNGEHGVSEMFALSKLTPNNIRDLIEISKGVINDISNAWNGSVHAFNAEAQEDTISLLEDLNSLMRSPPSISRTSSKTGKIDD